jgi:hypothetical protein
MPFLRSVGYKGSTSASQYNRPGWVLYSGSIFTDVTDDYSAGGVGAEFYFDSESYMRYGTSGKNQGLTLSLVDFNLGKPGGNRIIGNGTTLTITASGFKLDATGYITASKPLFENGVLFKSIDTGSATIPSASGLFLATDALGRLYTKDSNGDVVLGVNSWGYDCVAFQVPTEPNRAMAIGTGKGQGGIQAKLDVKTSGYYVENYNSGSLTAGLRVRVTHPSASIDNVYSGHFEGGKGLNISGSFYINNNRQFNYGAFSDDTDQSGSAGVSASMKCNTVDVYDGVSIVSQSRLTVPSTGIYNIQFSAQLFATTGADNVYIWLKKNSVNISNTATSVYLRNNEQAVAAWNWIYPLSASDYVEIAWQSLNGRAVLEHFAASGNIPSIPSVIITVSQVA